MTKFRLPEDLYEYQRDDGNTIANSDQNWLLCHEMGVGKTAIAIWAAEQMGAQLPLVICPNSLRYEWARQIKEWTGIESAVSGKYYSSGGKMGSIIRSLLNGKERTYRVVNYESLRVGYAAELLQAVPWDVVIFDEVHKLRNPLPYKMKKVVEGAWRLLDKLPKAKILGLTGSPIMNYPGDLYGPLAACFPDKYPRSRAAMRDFLYKYALWTAGRRGAYAYGVQNIPELRERTKNLIIRRTKDEVLPFLPEKYYQRPELEMKEDQRKVYDQMEKELKVLLDTGEPLYSPSVLSTLTRLRQINLDPRVVGISASSAKTEYLLDLIDSTDEKLVIFTTFEGYVEQLSKQLDVPYVKVTGKVPVEKRAEAVKRFQEDDSCRVFLGTVQCAGEGITLTASSTVVLADRWWNEPANAQAVDRLHRIGQKSAVQVLLPVCQKSVDAVVGEILQRKHEASQSYFQETEIRESVFASLRS